MDREALPEHIRLFLNPAAYPHPVREIELIQTHISWVFLTGSFAYKIKKPVDFGFLNFTTLEKRRKACADELILNRRLAADIYLDVLPIYQKDEAFRLGIGSDSNSHIVDYCLKMVQFDQDELLDVRLEQGRFDPCWMDQLALLIAEFHLHAETGPVIERFGDPNFLYDHIQENLHVAERHPHIGQPDRTIANLRNKSRKWFDTFRERLAARQQNHHIRNCHGDLHLKNITLFNHTPTPFDCIEFNDEFRMIDTMNDVAFLIMDCDARGRSDLGYRFISRYLEQTGDYEGMQLLPIYLSYRAGVRGKVAYLEADDPAIEQDERSQLQNTAQHYFELAGQYLAPGAPCLFIIGGLSGSGKSHLALLGLRHLRAVIIRSDATRKRIAKQHRDLPLYSDAMHRLTYQAMLDAAASSVHAGFSAILDATFLHPASRTAAVKLAESLNIPFSFYWLDIDEERLRERVKQRSIEGSDISDADLQVLESQLTQYQRPAEPYIQYIKESGSWPPEAESYNTSEA